MILQGSARSRDDLDMERALRPRLNAPDVVRSTLSHKDFKYNENTIDSILGTPNKILIPERYIPEQVSYLITVINLWKSYFSKLLVLTDPEISNTFPAKCIN